MSMEFGGFCNDTPYGGQFNGKIPNIPPETSSNTAMNIVLTAVLAQLMGINKNLTDISNTLKELAMEDNEDEY